MNSKNHHVRIFPGCFDFKRAKRSNFYKTFPAHVHTEYLPVNRHKFPPYKCVTGVIKSYYCKIKVLSHFHSSSGSHLNFFPKLSHPISHHPDKSYQVTCGAGDTNGFSCMLFRGCRLRLLESCYRWFFWSFFEGPVLSDKNMVINAWWGWWWWWWWWCMMMYMTYDDVWWYIMIWYDDNIDDILDDDIWWYMMIYDDTWWYMMMIYDDKW